MTQKRSFNFSAGPAMLPLEVLERAGIESINYRGCGMSVMEMSHRSRVFGQIFDETKEKFKKLLSVPEDYEVLFLQGGASMQFSAVPLNLMGRTGKADYALTGNFSTLAWEEAKKYGDAAVACSSEDANHTYIPTQAELVVRPDASYVHYCANNTIYGTEWPYIPETGDVPLVCDMSSNIGSRPVDVSRYGVIYAGAQKNLAPAGLTVVIVKKTLAGHALPQTPRMLDWQTEIQQDSMYNTPPCWCIYMLGLMCDWLDAQGGVAEMERRNRAKARMLYETIDGSRHFQCAAKPGSRSNMNVTFRTQSPELDAQFVADCAQQGLVNLKGHRKVGGMRASIYNAMPVEGVERLCEAIGRFDKKY